jgi:SRSO17 transposase
MDESQLLQLKPELDRFLDQYVPLFGLGNNPDHARCFVQGLLHKGERRNAENIAEAIDGPPVRTLQCFIATGAWQDGDVLLQMRRDALELLVDEDAVWNTDETGFPKKGTKSVGVKRQYSGTLGRTDNCQIGVFANYASQHGHTFLDRRLFLPQEWAEDMERRREAGVPEGVVFRTKPQLGLEMIANAVAEKIPFRWVGGDSVYGDSPTYVQGVRALGKWYVVDTSADARVWTKQPQVIPAAERTQTKRGRPCTQPKVIDSPQRVDEVVAELPESAWQRIIIGEGSQGPRMYEYAYLWVWFSEEGLPGPKERLLVRRSLAQTPELKYHRAYAAEEIPLQKLAEVRGLRWTVEEDIQSGKGECGLDEYETRGWVGWHHHTALSMLALAFLVIQRKRLSQEINDEPMAGSEKKNESDNRARGPSVTGASIGGAGVGDERNPSLVPLEARTQSSRGRKPSQASARQTAPATK